MSSTFSKSDIISSIRSWFNKNGHNQVNGITVDYLKAGLIDSFGFVELIAFIETEFQIELNDKNFVDPRFRTIEGVGDIIFSHLQDR